MDGATRSKLGPGARACALSLSIGAGPAPYGVSS
jgi:hypothetical protein